MIWGLVPYKVPFEEFLNHYSGVNHRIRVSHESLLVDADVAGLKTSLLEAVVYIMVSGKLFV